MAEAAEHMEDFAEQLQDVPRDVAPQASTSQNAPEKKNKRNAFAELMSSKLKAPKSDAPDKKPHRSLKSLSPWKGALLDYIKHPERFPDQVIRSTPNAVLIKDSFPKATVHLLLLPRSPAHYDLHPHDAFKDLEFLAMMKEEAASAAQIAAAELGRRTYYPSRSLSLNLCPRKGLPLPSPRHSTPTSFLR